jgi:hypothetical protein
MVENKENTDTNNRHSSVERFTAFLSEKLQDQDAVIISDYYALATSQRFVDSGIIGIVQAVTDGLLPIYIARHIVQFSNIKEKLEKQGLSFFIILENKKASGNVKQNQLVSDINGVSGKLIDFDWTLEYIYDNCVTLSNYRHANIAQ